mmetsp:Transcript_3516/g.5874  ORF Transcript_3516/g.5874 Transcript_3516/m.5874 type:complete len:378 (+) Transcript_3516:222-1355(+)
MLCQYRLLFALLPLVLVSSWAPIPSSSMGSRLRAPISSRKANSFLSPAEQSLVVCQSQQMSEPDLEAQLTLPEMVEEWMEQIKEMDESELTEKCINALLLIAAFGFSFYQMVNIDHEFTRGWTQQEIAMRIPLDNWASYESALAEKPIITKTFINVVIYSLGDWLAQTVFQQKNVLDYDASRTLRNGFIGLCFGPLVHMYYEWSDHILPVEDGLMNRVKKVFMDQTLYLTVKCSIYIAAVGLLQGDDLKTVKENVEQRIGPICFTAWKFWPLVHCVTYGVIPGRHRMLWVNCVDLVWNAILASMSRDDEEELLLPAAALETTTSDAATVVAVEMVVAHAIVAAQPVLLSQQEEVIVMESSTSSTENVTAAATQPVML